ncbi:uncharacterized protein F4807DRAFT_437678 [Annulohypoxylon truncatum]|uniref:uncharacterized protein n=1 Tax=Annulohypoxylon truncatum TaxID=327061 RepID=UPI0020076BD0|nr:uncharacterized protein F4807DRAFT_437678 [Annulohypoxylon truncatum]KAI1206919.1 hypothetical protein F4807DRAFT_437678 [Annulohypoxylon truncatum]
MSAVVDELIKACGTSDTNCASAGSDWNVVYRQFSRYNHSCAPTVNWNISVRRRRMQMTTTADIRPDEELYVSYDWTATSVSDPMSLKERRRRLKQWGFTCACTRCMEEEKGIKLPLPPARGSEDELYSESSSSSSWSGTEFYPQEDGSEDEPAKPYSAPQYTYTEIPETYPTFQSALRSKFPTAEEIMETLNAFQKAPHHMPNPSFLWQENSESSNPEIVGRQLMMNHNLTKEVADLSEPEWHMSAPNRSYFANSY